MEFFPSAFVCTVKEHCVSSGKQSIPLAGCATIAPGDAIGTACAPLLEVSLDEVFLKFPFHKDSVY